MKKIRDVFLGDVSRVRKNVIAIIVIIGVIVVPALYAWFNIAGSWDPYGKTKDLKIAVASSDVGYKGNLINAELNIGDKIIENLKSNDKLDWQFVDEQQAVDGVTEGKYYAAIVIPQDFSRDIMSLFSKNMQECEIIYYSNEKESAIAPKVTDKGTEGIKEQINSVFIEDISKITLEAMQAVYQTAGEKESNSMLGNLKEHLQSMQTNVAGTSKTVSSFADMVKAIRTLLKSTGTFIDSAGNATADNADVLSSTESTVQGLQDALNVAFAGVDDIFNASHDSYQQISDEIDNAFDVIGQDVPAAASSLDGIAQEVQTVIDNTTAIRDSLNQVASSAPEMADVVKQLVGQLNQIIAQQGALRDQLNQTQANIGAAPDIVQNDYDSLQATIASGNNTLVNASADYQNNLKPQLDDLFSGLAFASGDVADVLAKLDAGTKDMTTLTGETVDNLKDAEEMLSGAAKRLNTVDEHLANVLKEIDKAILGGDLDGIQNIFVGDPTAIGKFLASPVEIKTEAIYPVENYGSAMAPFYTILAIWMGGIILVAMIKADVSKKVEKKLSLSPHQAYFGRYISFLILGLAQSTLIMLGNLYFLQIQCQHPLLLMLTGWVSSIVFVNIMYTLTISFGDVGKAIAVVFMVLQVAGSGGSFPIEVLPKFFRSLYPFMPFAHGMTAMRECIAGMYGNTYWISLGYLLCFLVPSLLLGLLLRKPIIKFNKYIVEKVEDTQVM